MSISNEELLELRQSQRAAEDLKSEEELMAEAARASLFTHAKEEEVRARASQLQRGMDVPGSSAWEPQFPPPQGSSSSHSTVSIPSQEPPAAESSGATLEVETQPAPTTAASKRPVSERWVLFDPIARLFPSSRSEKKKASKEPAKKAAKSESKKGKAETRSKAKAGEAPKKEDSGPK